MSFENIIIIFSIKQKNILPVTVFYHFCVYSLKIKGELDEVSN